MIKRSQSLILLQFLWKENMRQPRKLLKEFLYFVVIFTILLTFSLLLSVYQHNRIAAHVYAPYDILVRGISDEQVEEIRQLAFVEEVFPVILFSNTNISHGQHALMTNMYAVDGFQALPISHYSDRLKIKVKHSLLMNEVENPILIDWTLAQRLHAKLGSVIAIPFGEQGVSVSFTVAAIYEPMNYANIPSAVILWTGEQAALFANDFQERPHYYGMYVKTNDLDQAVDYFRNEYIPGIITRPQDMSLADWKETYDVEYRKQRANDWFTLRSEEVEMAMESLQFTPPVIVVITLFGFLIFVSLLFREKNKKLVNNYKNFAIFHAFGMPKHQFVQYFFIETIVLQLPVLILSCALVKWLVFDRLIRIFYLPVYVLNEYVWIIVSIQLAAILLNCGLLFLRMKKMNLSAILARE